MKNEKKENSVGKEDNVKKYKFIKFLAVIGIIVSLGALLLNYGETSVLNIIIIVLQLCLYILTIVIAKGVVKTVKSSMCFVPLLLGLVLIIPFFSTMEENTHTTIVWDEIVLNESFDEFGFEKGEVKFNDSDTLQIEVNATPKEFQNFIESSKTEGYTIDDEESSSSYNAFNDEGYELDLYYSDTNEELTIYVYAPVEYEEVEWSSSKIAGMLPEFPKADLLGEIIYDSENSFQIYISEISIDEYKEYIEDCKSKGFDVDPYDVENSYSASNGNGYKVSITYEGFNVISIYIYEETEDEEDDTEGSVEWQEFLEDYENWVDDYIDFMEKYNQNPTDLTLIQEYTDLALEAIEWADKANDLETDLSDDELIEFSNTMARIATKLASIQF